MRIKYALWYDTKEDSRSAHLKEFRSLEEAKIYGNSLLDKQTAGRAQIEARKYQFNGREWILLATKRYDPLINGSWYGYDWQAETL